MIPILSTNKCIIKKLKQHKKICCSPFHQYSLDVSFCKKFCAYDVLLKMLSYVGLFCSFRKYFGKCSFPLYKFKIHAVFSLCLFILWPVPFNLLRTLVQSNLSHAFFFCQILERKNINFSQVIQDRLLVNFCHILEYHLEKIQMYLKIEFSPKFPNQEQN